MSDDLRAPVSNAKDETGWVQLSEYGSIKSELPRSVKSLSDVVEIPLVLNRRLKYVGLVDREKGDSLHEFLEPGQRLVSLEGDLWRWDGYKICAEDTPSAAALQIQQVNKLKDLGAQLDILQKSIKICRSKHEELVSNLSTVTDQERTARQDRRDADQAVNDTIRKLNRVESEESLVKSQLENYQISERRFEE